MAFFQANDPENVCNNLEKFDHFKSLGLVG